jgi:Spy/CpxP family protein refolding chaperone
VSLLAGLAVTGWLAGAGGSVLASVSDQNSGQARAAGSPPSSQPQQNRVPGPWIQEWWKSPEVRKTLGLDEPTIKRIDSIYRKRSAELKETIDAYNKQSRILDEMTRAAVVDDGTYRQQVKLVEFYRTDIITSRTVMLYQMYRQLQPEQRGKLWGIFDTWRERAEAARERERANASSPALSGK